MDQAAHGVHGLKIPCIPSLLETVQMLQLSYRCIFRCPPSLVSVARQPALELLRCKWLVQGGQGETKEKGRPLQIGRWQV